MDEAPDQQGVYLFIDSKDDIVYIGAASVEGLKNTIKADSNIGSKNEIIKYRWFITKNLDAANEHKADWVKKYTITRRTKKKRQKRCG